MTRGSSQGRKGDCAIKTGRGADRGQRAQLSHSGRSGPQARIPSQEFDTWLTEAVCTATHRGKKSKTSASWSQAPSARLAHPREDHLIPLMVAVGAAEEESGVRVYHEDSFFGG